MHSRRGPPLLALVARKGGVGKSTLASLLARIYSKSGLNVLLVDLDPQGTSTQILVPDTTPDSARFGELLSGGKSLIPLICRSASERLSLLPTSEGLTMCETQLAGQPMGVFRVKQALESLQSSDCDLVLVDTPPSIGAFTFGALGAATWALIPTFCEEPSVRTLPSALATVAEARTINPELRILAIVANRLDRRTRHGLGALETLRQAFPEHLARTVIPAATSIIDCMRPGAVVDDQAHASAALVALAEELLGRMNGQPMAETLEATTPRSDCNDCSDCNAVEECKAAHPGEVAA